MFLVAIFCVLPVLASCAQRPVQDDDRLKKGIVIDGVNVSSMTVAEARESLRRVSDDRLDHTEVTLLLPEGKTSFTLSTLGADYDIESSVQAAAHLGSRGGTRDIQSVLSIDQTDLDAVLNAYVEEHEVPAEDASVSIDPAEPVPVTYHTEQTGIQIDSEALRESVRQAVADGKNCVLKVPYTQLPPAITVASLQSRQSLVAQYSTSFERSPYNAENRVYNIKKAAAAINGIVLQNGETFDCNAVLGDRTAENGWKEAPGIRDGKYEMEYGGGVCQVSSTLFNAVLMADLTVTERYPHSWPMGYIDIGRDATISTGGKNFCFINDSGSTIYLFVHVDEDTMALTVSIYGRPLPNGTYIEITSEKTGTLETASESIMLDETLPYNTRYVEREARDGKTSITRKELYSSHGELLESEVLYEDTYRSIDGITYVSTDIYYS